MATPIGHLLVAGLVYAGRPRSYKGSIPLAVLCVGLANAPDLDFLPGILVGKPSSFHHGISHSFGFGLAFTTIVVLVLKRTTTWFASHSLTPLLAIGLLSYASHILLDLVTLDNGVPYGMPLLWPVMTGYLDAPVYVLPNVVQGTGVLSAHNVGVALREVLIFGPLVTAILVDRVGRGTFGMMARFGALALATLAGAAVFFAAEANPYF